MYLRAPARLVVIWALFGLLAAGALAAQPLGGTTYSGSGQAWSGSLTTSPAGHAFNSGSFHIKMHCSNGSSLQEQWDPTHTVDGGNKPIPITAKGVFYSQRSGHQSAKQSGESSGLYVSEAISGTFATRTDVNGHYTTYLYFTKYKISCTRTLAFALHG